MCPDSNEKQQTRIDGRIKLTNQGKSELSEKRKLTNTWEYWKRTPLNKRKGKNLKKKRIHQKNEKTTQKQTTKLKSHQRDKQLGCLLRKILGIISKMDERRTPVDGSENKKTHNDA